MYRHYLKITLRLFAKNKTYILINTLGLGIAIACCLTVYVLFAYNIEFDRFHNKEKVANIFRIHSHIETQTGQIHENNSAPMPLAPEAIQSIAGIDKYTRFIRSNGLVQSGDRGFNENIAFADYSIFEMFDFPMQHGDDQSFEDKHTIYLSSELAGKIFDDKDPTGEVLNMYLENEKKIAVTVGGVLQKIPDNSSFTFDALMRIENYLNIHDLTEDNWSDWREPSTFLQLTNIASAPQIAKQLEGFIDKRNESKQDVKINSFQLEHFLAPMSDEVGSGYVRTRIEAAPLVVFGCMALMILFIACFNLTNTSIAMSTKRLKEIGIRKAIGAARTQIIGQFLSETLIVMLVSLIIAIVLAWLVILPEFSKMFNFNLGVADLSGFNLIFTLIAILVFAALLAGIYPALFNSRLHPVALVKGTIRIKGTNWLTRILTSAQFGLTVIFLIAGVIFFQNIRFQEKIGFGYDKDRLMVVNVSGETFDILSNEIEANPKITNISSGYSHLGYSSWESPIDIEGQAHDSRVMGIGENYFPTVGLSIVDGVDLDERNDADLETKVIVNRAFLEKSNLKNPLERFVTLEGTKRQIIGVVENHLDNISRSKEAEPFLFYLVEPEKYKVMVINTKASDLSETYKYVETKWHQLFPNRPFQGQLQDDILLGNSRELAGNMGKIFFFLTMLGVIMSIAGIYSLASLNIAGRKKEIGIRKILGATKGSIVGIINREFVIILLVSAIFGSVGGFFLTEALMSEIYELHISVGLVTVVVCALLIFGAGFMTTSRSILRAVNRNPMEALQSN